MTKQNHNLERMIRLAKWLLFSFVVGSVVGIVGTGFHYALDWANRVTASSRWLILFLPFAGLFIVWLYRIARMEHDKGANFILISLRTDDPITLKTAPLVFVTTVMTHLFGGSAGREGAALQIGASISDKMARLLRLESHDKKIVTMCGMAAAFAAVFGTPVAAAIFAMEVVSVGVMYYAAFVPCVLAASIAYMISKVLGASSLAYQLTGIPASVNPADLLGVLALGLLCAGLSWLFCLLLKNTASLYKKWISNPYLRVAAGGSLLVLMTLLVGSRDYNGAGTGVILNALQGQAVWYAFLIKALFTALTLGAGYKGGEIVPTFFVGATFGCAAGGLLGLDPSFAAGLGMIGVFCGVTNCPITSLIISVELFGAAGIVYFALMCALCYMLSGYTGLYTEQRILYSKFRPAFIDKKAK